MAPVAGQSSLDFFVKRLEKKNATEKNSEPRKATETQQTIAKASIKCPSISEFKNYTEWIQNKDVRVVEPNPEDLCPEKKLRLDSESAQKSHLKQDS